MLIGTPDGKLAMKKGRGDHTWKEGFFFLNKVWVQEDPEASFIAEIIYYMQHPKKQNYNLLLTTCKHDLKKV